MNNMLKQLKLVFLCALLSLSSCQNNNSHTHDSLYSHRFGRGIYHWKTTFNLSAADSAFVKDHNIYKLYVRMFDVDAEFDDHAQTWEAVPIATTVFNSSIPKGVKLIPTVYITLDALKSSKGNMYSLAQNIVKRILNMCSYNELGQVNEIHLDCDWTKSTKEDFAYLCSMIRKVIVSKQLDIKLSGTIRLHQLEEAEYPFDSGVLMIYNTGNIKDNLTKNSILDYDDVYKYLSVNERIKKFIAAREYNCLDIDVAYPAYSWGVVFYNNYFRKLVSNPKDYVLQEGETIRIENSEIETILKVKRLVDSKIGNVVRNNIIYHLDSNNLSKYSYDEIESIYN